MTFYRHVYLSVLFVLLCVSASSQTKRALLIGISEYQSISSVSSESEWNNIHGANDVLLLSPTLEKQGYRITKLCNKLATADRIRKNLRTLARNCQKGDLVYLHFSCHGQPVEDIDGDEGDGWDEAIIPVDAKKVYQKNKYTGENHITDDELNKYFRDIRNKIGPNGFVYIVVDACHAGSSYRGDEEEDSVIVRGTNRGFSPSGKFYAPKIDKRGKLKVEKSPLMANICIIEACRSYQVNSEIREKGHYYGSLSYYVNKVLQTTKLGHDITWIKQVERYMDTDIRLVKQNIVIETSL